MSSVKLILKKDKAKHSSLVPLYARITRNRRSSYISLGIRIDQDHWDDGSQRVNILHPNRIRMNATLGKVVNDIERVILHDMDYQTNLSSRQIKELVLGEKQYTFSQYFRMKLRVNLRLHR